VVLKCALKRTLEAAKAPYRFCPQIRLLICLQKAPPSERDKFAGFAFNRHARLIADLLDAAGQRRCSAQTLDRRTLQMEIVSGSAGPSMAATSRPICDTVATNAAS
jgi:hypothetical protein